MEMVSIPFNDTEIISKYEQPSNALSLVKEIKKYGVSAVDDWCVKDIVSLLKTADQAYYNDGESLTPAVKRLYQEVITDKVYDDIFDILKVRSPNNAYLKKVGAELVKSPSSHASQRMTKLPFPMASLDKIKPDTAQKWLSKVSQVVVSNKVDGVSLGIISDGKGNIQLVSRGNGETGQDISYLLPYIPSLKKLSKTKKKFKIRGELVIPKSKFKKYEKDYANPRNQMAGIINKGSISSAFKDVLFVGYTVVEPKLKPVQAFEFLDSLGVETPNWKVIENPTVLKVSKLLETRRKSAPYDIDGLVVTDTSRAETPSYSNPKYSKAFKMQFEDQSTQVVVDHVEWNLGKTGSIVPKIVIKPVKLDGVTIRNVAAHNAKFVKDEKLGPGAVITLIRSGGVIPKIEEVIKPAKRAQMPTDISYVWNGVHIILDDENNLDAVDQLNVKRITSFYRTLGVENVSSGIFERLYDNGYTDIFKIARITVKKLLSIPGFKETSARKVYNEIKGVLEDVPISLAMYGSSCFNRLLGVKRLEQIVINIPDFMKLSTKTLQSQVSSLTGFNDKTASAFVEGLPCFKLFLPKLEKVATVSMPKKKRLSSSKLKGQVIVFTGFRDSELSNLIQSNGGIEGSSVSTKTTILVVKSKSSNSSKTEKAKSLGIKIMSVDEFTKWLNQIL